MALELWLRATIAISIGACSSHRDAPYTGAGGALDPDVSEQSCGSAATSVVTINEVESSGDSDWVELHNSGDCTADLSGWVFADEEDDHTYAFPAGTTLSGGQYFALDEAVFGFGLGREDAARLLDAGMTIVDTYTWVNHAPTTYGRCLDGVGAFVVTGNATKEAPNDCSAGVNGDAGVSDGGSSDVVFEAWPSVDGVATADLANTFGTNMSGLFYQPAIAAPDSLWAVQNGPSKLHRLTWDGTNYVASPGWSGGRALAYPNGGGAPDAEGVTGADGSSAIYVAAERDNDRSSVSRQSVLQFDSNASSTSLRATQEWNLTSDLPATGANVGVEAIAWISDLYLVSHGFFDEHTSLPYDPSVYPDHGAGLFIVGLEANGTLFAYALNHASGAFARVATIPSGLPANMDLSFDADSGYLWAQCDNTCGNKTAVLQIVTEPNAPNRGRFHVRRIFNRPTTLPDTNNEGLAIAPDSDCQDGVKTVVWADDDQSSGHALRRGTAPCGAFIH